MPLIQYFQAINYLYGTVENWWRALQKRINMISYSYDETGFRTRKGMTGTQTWFDCDAAGNLVHETRNNGKDHLYYYYDASGSIGSISYNGVRYAFRKNLQGDVIAILDTSGNVVARYTYDAWGRILSITDGNGNANTSSTFIGNVNPIRYRGYYYDTETGWYYLNSRYYDPQVKRFINADGIIGANGVFTGYNMFAYCNNNPIILLDTDGFVTGYTVYHCSQRVPGGQPDGNGSYKPLYNGFYDPGDNGTSNTAMPSRGMHSNSNNSSSSTSVATTPEKVSPAQAFAESFYLDVGFGTGAYVEAQVSEVDIGIGAKYDALYFTWGRGTIDLAERSEYGMSFLGFSEKFVTYHSHFCPHCGANGPYDRAECPHIYEGQELSGPSISVGASLYLLIGATVELGWDYDHFISRAAF